MTIRYKGRGAGFGRRGQVTKSKSAAHAPRLLPEPRINLVAHLSPMSCLMRPVMDAELEQAVIADKSKPAAAAGHHKQKRGA